MKGALVEKPWLLLRQHVGVHGCNRVGSGSDVFNAAKQGRKVQIKLLLSINHGEAGGKRR